MIRTVNENKIVNASLDAEGRPVVHATATRLRPGTLWSVWYREHMKDGSHRETIHARVSGKLPKDLQSRMIVNLLDLAPH